MTDTSALANPFDLTGQVAVITGGGSGIGLSMATALAQAGSDVCLWGRRPELVERAAADLAALGRRTLGLSVDVTDEGAVEAAMARTLETFGRVDTCIANAGVGGGGTPFLETSLEEFRRVQRTNVEGAFLTLREAAKPMVAQGDGGSLVGIASLAAIHGQPRGQSYAASKGGLISMIKAIAIELARHDIRANAVLPGWTMTPMAEPVLTWDRFREKVLPRMPVGRWGLPDDFGAVAVYLASPASAFHTADTLLLDGGYSAF
ncbi:SDR family oxidoreductase [Iamia sp. SCSIO 61187]|uniref:SDR family NAD(P)-dependent oxidoreductase n=1 Tax=Iamia sp. SCSIO 61187 TaxID=2722752 RepID=UPI001C629CDA|nr:SDR family NAD(P)-dependent oxidoreductase [Iamia sp. SCSIO 61187]QYG91045.1 SDR family oxidoreductase [Iamia sp. SCSIO 61187]